MQKLPAALKHAITESALDGWVDLDLLYGALAEYPYPDFSGEKGRSYVTYIDANIWARMDTRSQQLTVLADNQYLVQLLKGGPGSYHFPAPRNGAGQLGRTLVTVDAGHKLRSYDWFWGN